MRQQCSTAWTVICTFPIRISLCLTFALPLLYLHTLRPLNSIFFGALHLTSHPPSAFHFAPLRHSCVPFTTSAIGQSEGGEGPYLVSSHAEACMTDSDASQYTSSKPKTWDRLFGIVSLVYRQPSLSPCTSIAYHLSLLVPLDGNNHPLWVAMDKANPPCSSSCTTLHLAVGHAFVSEYTRHVTFEWNVWLNLSRGAATKMLSTLNA